ncbi:MAG: hypothetical protein KGH58_04540 [Candidatus Micrarchaeota archaeon]|nr:hypothetical protein [Candidatus Micrarchaeota archaeon]
MPQARRGAKSGARRDSQTDAWITSIARDIGADDRTQEIASGLLTLDDKIRARFISLHQNWRAYLAGGLIHLASIRRAAEAGAEGYLYLRTRVEIVNSNTIRNLDEKVNWNTHETSVGKTIKATARLIGMRASEFPPRLEFAKRQVKVMCDRMGLDDKIRLEVNAAIEGLASTQGHGAVNSSRMLGKIIVAAHRHGKEANTNGLWLPASVMKQGQQYARQEEKEVQERE